MQRRHAAPNSKAPAGRRRHACIFVAVCLSACVITPLLLVTWHRYDGPTHLGPSNPGALTLHAESSGTGSPASNTLTLHTVSSTLTLHAVSRPLTLHAASNPKVTLHTASSPKVASHASPLTLPVWWFAPWLDYSSFGTEATQLLLPLVDRGMSLRNNTRISLLQMACHDSVQSSMDPSMHASLMGLLHAPPLTRPAIVVCHNMPLFMGRPAPKWASCFPCPPPRTETAYTIARAMAETSRIPPEFASAINSLDEVWVPSHFSREVLAKSGVDEAKVRIVPLAVNTTHYDRTQHAPFPPHTLHQHVNATEVFRGAHRRNGLAGRSFVFLSVAKWEARKGLDVLIRAYLEEFKEHHEVVLCVVTRPFSGGNITEEVTKLIPPGRGAINLPRLLLVTSHLDAESYTRLLATADAFVLPTRGEGWGLPMVEAMSMGLPVLATNYSGVTAYLDYTVGYPLNYKEVQVPDSVTEGWFKGSWWAEPDKSHLRHMMRRVYNHPEEAWVRGTAARKRVVERYSHAVMSTLLYNEFRRIERKLGIKTDEQPDI